MGKLPVISGFLELFICELRTGMGQTDRRGAVLNATSYREGLTKIRILTTLFSILSNSARF